MSTRGRRSIALSTTVALGATMMLGLTSPAVAATGGTELYAVATTDTTNDGVLTDQSLYRVDVADAGSTKVVDLEIDNVRGMDFSPIDNQLWVTAHDGGGGGCDTAGILPIDLTDGSAGTTLDTNLYAPDAAFGPDGTFYVWDEFNCRADDATGADDMWTVDTTTGDAVELGDSGLSTYQTGVAVAADGTLWVISGGNLYTIDPDTGAGTFVVSADVGDTLDNALAFGPDGTMYAIDRTGATTNLHTIDPTDGTTTLVGDMGVANVTTIAFRDANPVAADDAATVDEGGTVTIAVLDNDTDAEGDELTPEIVTEPSNGTVEVNPDGTLTYVHDGSETTSDTFTYTVSDGVNDSNEATVTITVDPTGLSVVVLGGPVAVSDDVVDDVDDLTSGDPTTRYAGGDRYKTSVDISQKTFSPGVPVAYVANASTDEKYPDALAGGPSAATLGGPVLLIQQDDVPDAVTAELDRLAPANIVILGGDLAVAPEVETELADHTAGEVFRWGGADRFDTSAIVSARTFEPGVDQVWIATGRNFADALAAGPAAVMGNGPVLLVEKDSIPQSVADELDRLDPASIYVAGGPDAIDQDVVEALEGHTTGDVTRVFGGTRYETATEISERFFGGTSTAFLATGLKFPDALAGVVPAALQGAPILLTNVELPESTRDEIVRLEDLA